jgi:hypothetical protein
LCRYSGLWIVLLLPVYPFLRRHWRLALITPAVAFVLIAAWEFWTRSATGKPHFLSSIARWSVPFDRARYEQFGFMLLIYLGAQLPLTGITFFAVGARNRLGPIFLAAGLGLVVLCARDWAGPGWADSLRPGLLFAWPAACLIILAGANIVSAICHRLAAKEPADAIRWTASLWLVPTTFATVSYQHVAVKYVLLPLPAAVLLLLDALRDFQGWRKRIKSVLVPLSLVVGVVLALAVALSDARWSNTYRDFFANDYPRYAPAPGHTAYFNADWGFRYYAERAGLTPYEGNPLAPGDRLFMSTVVGKTWYELPQVSRVVAAQELHYPGPFAVMNAEHRAGFYDFAWGPWPFTPASEVKDTIVVFEE